MLYLDGARLSPAPVRRRKDRRAAKHPRRPSSASLDGSCVGETWGAVLDRNPLMEDDVHPAASEFPVPAGRNQSVRRPASSKVPV
jgi:hypothetical protein